MYQSSVINPNGPEISSIESTTDDSDDTQKIWVKQIMMTW
jgi:hypothetical protein